MGKALVRLKKADTFGGLAAQKLESSGLTVEQATQLGMYDVTNAATLEPWFEGKPGLVIPYFGLDGKPLKAHTAWPEFYRVRYLGEDHSFKAATEEKAKRYAQPSDTGVCAYFPQLADWKNIAKDPKVDLLITEGELKAAKATAEGFPTIGLGGVHNFRSSRAGIFFLPELETFEWARRYVTIAYDSDYQTNSNICAAINMLAEELQERGALVNVLTLESVYDDEDRKTGLDDFLIERGKEALEKLIEVSDPLAMSRRLWQMNEEVLYVEDPGYIVAQGSGQILPVANFTGHSKWATASTPERKVRPDGAISMVKAPAAGVWLKWPLRESVSKLTYAPGEEQFTEKNGVRMYNRWKGWGVEPKKGDIKPYLELIKFVFDGAERDHVEWFLDWCAYPIQFPGTKLFSACLIHGRRTGTGKTLLFYTLKRIYGENFIKIKNEDLFQSWWYENKQFVLGDEISGTDKRSESDALKTIITQEEVNVNVKYIPQFSLPDVMNYGFTSNHADAMFLEDEDRRYFIHEVPHTEPLPEAFYKGYDKWMSDGGPAALMHWFMERDLSKFNPKGPAPRTAARERMIMSGKGDLDAWCRELKENPSAILRVGQLRHARDMFTSKELLEMYRRDHDAAGKVTANGVGRALGRAGFKQAYAGMPIGTGRYYIIRNTERWEKVKAVKELAKNIALAPTRD